MVLNYRLYTHTPIVRQYQWRLPIRSCSARKYVTNNYVVIKYVTVNIFTTKWAFYFTLRDKNRSSMLHGVAGFISDAFSNEELYSM